MNHHIDQLALDAAEDIAQLAHTPIAGGETQYKAEIQCVVAEAIRKATEAAERERDDYRHLSDKYSDLWRSERDRADALAAHVEDLHARIRALHVGGRSIANLDSRLATLLCLKPAISLARLKAEWQAEVLDFAADDLRISNGPDNDDFVSVSDMRQEAARLRHQAEGGEL